MATARVLAGDGFHAAAASRARLASPHGGIRGDAFAKEQAEAAVREEMHKWAHLLEGAQSAAMFESAPETLKAILTALGQTDLETDKSLETARVNRVVLDALMDMDKGAAAKVRETMLREPAAAALAPGLAARAELMTGWVDQGLARFEDDPEMQIALLFRCAAAVFEDNPTAAGRLIAKAEEIAGGDIGLVGALAEMIDAAAESGEESALWAMLLAEAESRLTRETPEAPETPKEPREPEIE